MVPIYGGAILSEQFDDKNLPDVLERMSELDQKIKDVGVTKANFQQIRALLTEYDELEIALEAKRQKQFWDTAYAFLVEQKIATTKNNMAFAPFLRHFAAHVVRETAKYLDVPARDIGDVVDHIPEMDMSEAEDRSE